MGESSRFRANINSYQVPYISGQTVLQCFPGPSFPINVEGNSTLGGNVFSSAIPSIVPVTSVAPNYNVYITPVAVDLPPVPCQRSDLWFTGGEKYVTSSLELAEFAEQYFFGTDPGWGEYYDYCASLSAGSLQTGIVVDLINIPSEGMHTYGVVWTWSDHRFQT